MRLWLRLDSFKASAFHFQAFSHGPGFLVGRSARRCLCDGLLTVGSQVCGSRRTASTSHPALTLLPSTTQPTLPPPPPELLLLPPLPKLSDFYNLLGISGAAMQSCGSSAPPVPSRSSLCSQAPREPWLNPRSLPRVPLHGKVPLQNGAMWLGIW